MRNSRLIAGSLLIVGAGIAVSAPAYLMHARPSVAGYLAHRDLFAYLFLPYGLCALLWLPWRSNFARVTSVYLAGVLLVGTVLVNLPIFLNAESQGGDMVGMAFWLESMFASAALVVLSALIGLVRIFHKASR